MFPSSVMAWNAAKTVLIDSKRPQQGYKTGFVSAADLMLMLEAAQRQGRYREVMHRAINAYKLLVIDEIGYLPMSREQANLFFQLVARRYEHGPSSSLRILLSAAGMPPSLATAYSRGRCSTACCITRLSSASTVRATGSRISAKPASCPNQSSRQKNNHRAARKRAGK